MYTNKIIWVHQISIAIIIKWGQTSYYEEKKCLYYVIIYTKFGKD